MCKQLSSRCNNRFGRAYLTLVRLAHGPLTRVLLRSTARTFT